MHPRGLRRGSQTDRTLTSVSIRIRPIPLIAICTFSFVLGTFSGLAGFLSAFLSVILPVLCITSLIHLLASWQFFALHQNFSNDHPRKGEIVRYSLRMTNEGAIPLAAGMCHFADPGPASSFIREAPVPNKGHETISHDAEIRCSYRGTYVIGLSSVSFHDIMGMLEVETAIEPRVFYVYPELVPLDSRVDRLASSSGSDKPGSSAREEDPTIFEYLSPLVPGKMARHIAWKRWATTGIPAETIHGQARSSALTIVLDLWPGYATGTEKLASEDIAMSAVFSLLQYLAKEQIPVELIYGGHERGTSVDSLERFTEIFEQTTNVFFDDASFPAAAFKNGTTALLVTTRPLVDYMKTTPLDLFTAYESGLMRGSVPHILICPPPERADEERKILTMLAEKQASYGARGLLSLSDSRQGLEDIANALRY